MVHREPNPGHTLPHAPGGGGRPSTCSNKDNSSSGSRGGIHAFGKCYIPYTAHGNKEVGTFGSHALAYDTGVYGQHKFAFLEAFCYVLVQRWVFFVDSGLHASGRSPALTKCVHTEVRSPTRESIHPSNMAARTSLTQNSKSWHPSARARCAFLAGQAAVPPHPSPRKQGSIAARGVRENLPHHTHAPSCSVESVLCDPPPLLLLPFSARAQLLTHHSVPQRISISRPTPCAIPAHPGKVPRNHRSPPVPQRRTRRPFLAPRRRRGRGRHAGRRRRGRGHASLESRGHIIVDSLGISRGNGSTRLCDFAPGLRSGGSGGGAYSG